MLVKCETIRIVAGVGAEKAGHARLFGDHFTAKLAIGKHIVANDIDLANLGFRAFADFKYHIDAVLAQLNHLRLDRGGETALTLVQFNDTRNIGANFGSGENLACSQLDFRNDLVVLDPLVPFQDDAVDHRVFSDVDDDVAALVANAGIREQFSRVKFLQRLVGCSLRIGLSCTQGDVAEDSLRLEAFCTNDRDRLDDLSLRLRAGLRRCRFGSFILSRGHDGHPAQHRSAKQCQRQSATILHVVVAAHFPSNHQHGFPV